MYTILTTVEFDRKVKKLTKKNKLLKKEYSKAVKNLSKNPFHPSLNTHPVESVGYGRRMSSTVTGDLRIIWDFDENEESVILLLTTGGHSGSNKVYR